MKKNSKKTNRCQVHYDFITISSPLREITYVTLKSLQETKKIREQLGGENYHCEQCESIPEALDDSYFIHPECYKKFIYAQTLLKRKQNIDENQLSKVARLKRSSNKGTSLFPPMCMICKSKTMKVSGKKQFPKKLLTFDAAEQIKRAAEKRHDDKLLVEIAGQDLIAREFQKHEKCYRDYTRILYSGESKHSCIYESGDYKAVCEIIKYEVIAYYKCISLETIIEAYEIGKGQKQYRHMLKNRLIETFGDSILFLSPEYHSVQVVISRKCLHEQTLSSSVNFSEESIVTKAADVIRTKVLKKVKESPELAWPPSVDQLEDASRDPPDLLAKFYHRLIVGDCHHTLSEQKHRIIRSFSEDVMYAVSNGTFLTKKHYAVGMGLHSLTGMKQPIVFLSKMGHCISYDKVAEIETAQAELSLKWKNDSLTLPLNPEGAC